MLYSVIEFDADLARAYLGIHPPLAHSGTYNDCNLRAVYYDTPHQVCEIHILDNYDVALVQDVVRLRCASFESLMATIFKMYTNSTERFVYRAGTEKDPHGDARIVVTCNYVDEYTRFHSITGEYVRMQCIDGVVEGACRSIMTHDFTGVTARTINDHLDEDERRRAKAFDMDDAAALMRSLTVSVKGTTTTPNDENERDGLNAGRG